MIWDEAQDGRIEEIRLGLTAEQIAERRSFIGGSDAASIVAGGDEWIKLWRIKTGRAEPEDLSNILAVQMGSFTEPFNCAWYRKQTRREVYRRGETVRHPAIPYLGGNLDGVTTTSMGRDAYIDFKHTGKAGDALTLRYTAACTHYATVLDLDWWCLSVFVGNNKWELIEQEVDPFFAGEYIAKCDEFWNYVIADSEPPTPEPLPVPPPRKLRIIQLDDEFKDSWPNWGVECVEQFGKFASTHAAATANAIAKEDIKKLMPEDVGLITRGRIKAARDRAGAVRISITKGEA